MPNPIRANDPHRKSILQRYAVLVAAAGLFSVVTGDAFTTNEERPFYSFGQSHLVLGIFAGVLSIGLVIGLLRIEKRAWMRRLAWIALAIVIPQCLLGFMTVPQLPAERFAHAFLAQLLFAATAAVAFFTTDASARVPTLAGARPSLRILGMITATLVLVQAALGVAFRQGFIDVIPHVLGALVVAIFVAALAMSVLYRQENEPLRPAGVTLLIVTAVQVFVGLALFSMASDQDIDPEAVIIVTLLHAALSALTLAATVVAVALILRGIPASVNRPTSRGRR